MATAIIRKQTAFRLSEKLLDELKIRASKANRSLNNYVESLLMDYVNNTPNDDTLNAILETRKGKYAGKLDMSSMDAFLKSIDNIK